MIVAGKNSGFDAHEHRANFAIFKDIDIEAQLTKALEALFLGSRVIKAKAAVKKSRSSYSCCQPSVQPSLMRQPNPHESPWDFLREPSCPWWLKIFDSSAQSHSRFGGKIHRSKSLVSHFG